MIGQPALPRVLLPVIAGNRGCALRRLYALREDVAENEAVLVAAKKCLLRYRPDPQRRPHLVARIDDPRHADHWRGAHIGISGLWLEDALSAHESTASAVAGQLALTGATQVLLCGDSTLALAILRELARRAWEQRELAEAAAAGRDRDGRDAAARDEAARPDSGQEPVAHVLLLDQRAEDLRREYLATSPPPIAQALPAIRTEPSPWQGALVNSKVVPWNALAAGDRAAAAGQVRSQLAQLEDVGFMPVVPEGGPPPA